MPGLDSTQMIFQTVFDDLLERAEELGLDRGQWQATRTTDESGLPVWVLDFKFSGGSKQLLRMSSTRGEVSIYTIPEHGGWHTVGAVRVDDPDFLVKLCSLYKHWL